MAVIKSPTVLPNGEKLSEVIPRPSFSVPEIVNVSLAA